MAKAIHGDPAIDDKMKNLYKAIVGVTKKDLVNCEMSILADLQESAGVLSLHAGRKLHGREAQVRGGIKGGSKPKAPRA